MRIDRARVVIIFLERSAFLFYAGVLIAERSIYIFLLVINTSNLPLKDGSLSI